MEFATTHKMANAVDIGLHRSNNEDSAAALEIGWIEDQPVSLAVIADGMGGFKAGEIASSLAVDTLIRQISKNWRQFDCQTGRSYTYWLSEAVKAANQKIYNVNATRDEDMGTTLVAALMVGSRTFIANVGDSRAYHISRGGITQITSDHSLVQGLVNAGMITPEQAKSHSLRSCITQAVGTDANVDVDVFSVDMEADDLLMLCSDGLSNELDDNQIYEIIQAASSPQSACLDLIQAALRSGGRDNIAVVLVQLQAEPASLPMLETLEMMGV